MRKILKVMDSSGDSRMEFDESDVKATEEAKALFERMTQKSARVFAVNRAGGQPDKVVSNFNELEAENVIVPLIVGG